MLDRPSIADGTAHIRAEMLAHSPGFEDCWNKVVRQSVLDYGMGEYVNAVESLADRL
jgi:hypothetical protein